MPTTGEVVGAGIGIASIGGALAYLFTRKPKPTTTPPTTPVLSSINLTATTNSAVPNTAITFTANAYDQKGNPYPNASLVLIDKTTSVTVAFSAATNSLGEASLSVNFPNTGTFVFYAEPQNATTPQSNTTTITISPLPTCNAEQYYDSALGQCVCYSTNPANIALNQPTIPTLYMETALNDVPLAHTQWACWITPTSTGSCPTNIANGPTGCLPNKLQFVKVTGSVTDPNGNPCGDTGSCQKYKVYFALTPTSEEYTFTTPINELIYTAYNTWQVKFNFGTYDSSGNPTTSMYADANGNFTVFIGVSIDLISTSGYNPQTSQAAPLKTQVLQLSAGFNPGQNNVNSGGAITFNIQDCMYSEAVV